MNKVLTEINSLIKEYGAEVASNIESRIETCADEILDYIKRNCPRSVDGSNHLADSFIKTKIRDSIYISSRTKGKLVHLIELGFKHTSGKFVRGRPFLVPGYEMFSPKMLEDIKRIISDGTK